MSVFCPLVSHKFRPFFGGIFGFSQGSTANAVSGCVFSPIVKFSSLIKAEVLLMRGLSRFFLLFVPPPDKISFGPPLGLVRFSLFLYLLEVPVTPVPVHYFRTVHAILIFSSENTIFSINSLSGLEPLGLRLFGNFPPRGLDFPLRVPFDKTKRCSPEVEVRAPWEPIS